LIELQAAGAFALRRGFLALAALAAEGGPAG
jgi:hypothetical protein